MAKKPTPVTETTKATEVTTAEDVGEQLTSKGKVKFDLPDQSETESKANDAKDAALEIKQRRAKELLDILVAP